MHKLNLSGLLRLNSLMHKLNRYQGYCVLTV